MTLTGIADTDFTVDVSVPVETRAVTSVSPRRAKCELIAFDAGTAAVAMLAGYMASRVAVDPKHHRGDLESFALAVVALPIWMAIFNRYHLFTARYVKSRLDEFNQLMHAIGASVIVTAGLGALFELHAARGWLVATFLIAVPLMMIERELVRARFQRLRAGGRLLRPVVVVGNNAEAARLIDLLNRKKLGYQVVGAVYDQSLEQLAGPSLATPWLGPLSDVEDVLERVGASGVILASTALDDVTSCQLARRLTHYGYHVEVSSSVADVAVTRTSLHSLDRHLMVHVEPNRVGGLRATAKRSFDVVGATMLLIAVAPILLVVAVLVKLTSPGPVIFRQERVGRDGSTFLIRKFRTMVAGAEALQEELWDLNEADGPLFKLRHDPRVTRVGSVLRRYSLDELPQLWNVVRGEMSLVGPRPALPNEVRAWSSDAQLRLHAQPGITGMWQVSGRSNVSFDEYVRLDLYYVENWSIWIDLAILAKTLPVVISHRGAY